MRQQTSNLTVYVALTLAVLAAIASMPSHGRDTEAKVLWLLTAQGTVDRDIGFDMDEAQMLRLP